jgi:hypothetical protein
MLGYQKSSAAPSPFTCEFLLRHFALLVLDATCNDFRL